LLRVFSEKKPFSYPLRDDKPALIISSTSNKLLAIIVAE
jgi:hypothetical protein